MFYTLVLNSINNHIYITLPHISANEHILHIVCTKYNTQIQHLLVCQRDVKQIASSRKRF